VTASRAVLLDLDGTLTDGVGGPALPGAIDAVRRLRARVPVRFVTNTTSRTPRLARRRAVARGVRCRDRRHRQPDERRARRARRARPRGGDPARRARLAPELSWYRPTTPERARSVLLATEGHDLSIGDLAPAIEALLGGARLYTLQATGCSSATAAWSPTPARWRRSWVTRPRSPGRTSAAVPAALRAGRRLAGVAIAELAMCGDDASSMRQVRSRPGSARACWCGPGSTGPARRPASRRRRAA